MSSRVTTHLADTGYLLCFGAVPKGLDLLNEMFAGGIAAVPAVKAEIEVFATGHRGRSELRAAATPYLGKRAAILADVLLEESDLAECFLCLARLGSSVTGEFSDPHMSGASGRMLPAESNDGQHCGFRGENSGESESIAVCTRLLLPLLMCDSPGRRHAATRGVITECAAESLRRLLPAKTPRELYQLYLVMQRRGGDPGAVVSGHLWFRVPEKSPDDVAPNTVPDQAS